VEALVDARLRQKMSRRQRAEQPIETAVIRDITLDGRGITAGDDKPAFVDGAITGETVRFRRRLKRKGFDEGTLIELLQVAAARVEPPCENFGRCGGCSLQHLDAETQLQLKQDSLLQALRRIGNVTPDVVLDPLAGKPLGYRRRARLGVRLVEKKGRVLVGFREKRSSYIAEMHSCETLKPELSRLIPELSELIGTLRIRQKVPQVEVSMGDASISLIFRVLDPPSAEDHQKLLDFAAAQKVEIWLQTGGPDTVAPLLEDANPEPLWYQFPEFDLRLEFGPLDFIQVNHDMNRRMVAQAMQLAAPLRGERVLDLFCGIGNFSLPLARLAGQVVGVELDPRMVRKAQANATANGIDNAEFYAADLSVDYSEDSPPPDWWGRGFDLVVIDPPRAGAQEVLRQVAATGASRILYVSCHPGSLARDAGILCGELGYCLRSAGAMDMFPQTSHVEAMALFERQG
jgi:23S rRNA (uracil1939-C5)-methyltransferase